VHIPFQEEPPHHLKPRAAADNWPPSLLGIGVADAGNARGTEHEPPAVLAGRGCGEHAKRERRQDDEVANRRFRRPQHVGECVNDDPGQDRAEEQTETVVVRGLSLAVPIRRMIARELLAGILIGLALASRPIALGVRRSKYGSPRGS
jgi:hypothetical protein